MAPKLKSHGLWIRALQLVLGIVCFSLNKHNGYIPCKIQSVQDAAIPTCRIIVEIAIAALDPYPVMIIPIFILTHFKYGSKFDSNIFNPLFAFVGFIVFIVAGVVEVKIMTESEEGPSALTALGAMLIITSMAFLFEIGFWYSALRRDSGARPTTTTLGLVSTSHD